MFVNFFDTISFAHKTGAYDCTIFTMHGFNDLGACEAGQQCHCLPMMGQYSADRTNLAVPTMNSQLTELPSN